MLCFFCSFRYMNYTHTYHILHGIITGYMYLEEILSHCMAKVESHKVIDGHYSGVLKSVVVVRVEHLLKEGYSY